MDNMAEYIDRTLALYEAERYEKGITVNIKAELKALPNADVIERSKIDKAIEEIEDLDPITERVGLQVKQEILNILKEI